MPNIYGNNIGLEDVHNFTMLWPNLRRCVGALFAQESLCPIGPNFCPRAFRALSDVWLAQMVPRQKHVHFEDDSSPPGFCCSVTRGAVYYCTCCARLRFGVTSRENDYRNARCRFNFFELKEP